MPDKCEIRPFPISRRFILDACAWGRKKHIIHGFLECDVTRARQLLRERKGRADALSFTAFITACVGRAVAENRHCHAYRKGGKLLLFDDVDIGTLVETEVEGEKLALLRVIRATDKKSVREIHEEIRAAQKQGADSRRAWKIFLRFPYFVRRWFYWWMDRHPEIRKKFAGTVVLSAIGMAGAGAGWALPIASNTLTITVGGIETKPGVWEGRIEPREYLYMTVSVDHDVVDGMPAARFSRRLRQLVEKAVLLEEDLPDGSSAQL